MISTLQNIGHTAPAALNLTSQHSAAAKKTSFEDVMNTDTKSLARELYDSVSHLDPVEASQALLAKPERSQWRMNGKEHEEFMKALELVANKTELEGYQKHAEVFGSEHAKLIEELPTATGERLAFLQIEIPALKESIFNARQKAEQLEAKIAQMIDDL